MSKDIEELGKDALRKLEVDEAVEVGAFEPSPIPLSVISIEELREKKDRGEEFSSEEAAAFALYSAKKARTAQIMHRGIINDKLQLIIDTSVPEGRRGKFIRDNKDDIMRYKNLHYDFQYKKGGEKGLHAEADGRIRVGDVVLMTISIEDLQMLREIRQEKVQWKLDQGKQEYIGPATSDEQTSGRGLVSSFDESSRTVHTARS